PKKVPVIVDVEKDHGICGSVIDGNDALLVAIWFSQLERFMLEIVKKFLRPRIFVNRAFSNHPQTFDEALVEESRIKLFLGVNELRCEIRVVRHSEVLRPENPLTSQIRIIQVGGFKPMKWTVRIGRAVESGA